MDNVATRSPRRSNPPQLPANEPTRNVEALPQDLREDIREDDLCPICHLLLCEPMTTTCNHTMCRFCLDTWADASVTRHMVAAGLDENTPEVLLSSELQSSCPMCRTSSTAQPNTCLTTALSQRYPLSYAERQAEGQSADADASVETLTLYVGNTHRDVRVDVETTSAPESHNRHEWKFFVRPSRTDIIEEVQIFLHPTFQNAKVIKWSPPYEIRRLGWGYFNIQVNVVLKVGYQWLSSDAEDTSDGQELGSLPLEWLLDFEGGGSQKRCRLKVRRENGRG